MRSARPRRRTRHQREGALSLAGHAQQLEERGRGAEERRREQLSGDLGDVATQERRQGPVGAGDPILAVHHRHALGEGVERRLPLLLGAAHQVEEPGVGDHHRGVGGQGGDQPKIFGGEHASARVRHHQGAYHRAVSAEGDRGGGFGKETGDEDDRSGARVPDQLQAFPAHRPDHQARVGAGNDGADLGSQGALGGGHDQGFAVVLTGEGDQGAPGLQEAHRVADHVLDDAVELEGIGQDVRQLLQGEQLGEPPVQLVGGATPLVFTAAEPQNQIDHRRGQRRQGDRTEDREQRAGQAVLSATRVSSTPRGPGRGGAPGSRAAGNGSRNRWSSPRSSPSVAR